MLSHSLTTIKFILGDLLVAQNHLSLCGERNVMIMFAPDAGNLVAVQMLFLC